MWKCLIEASSTKVFESPVTFILFTFARNVSLVLYCCPQLAPDELTTVQKLMITFYWHIFGDFFLNPTNSNPKSYEISEVPTMSCSMHFVASIRSAVKISPSPAGRASQYVNSEGSGSQRRQKGAQQRGFFGRQLSILNGILTKIGTLMGTMVPHHAPKFYQKRPTDGREIGDALLFLVRHVPGGPEPKGVGTRPPKLGDR